MNGVITTVKLADNAVTTAKLVDQSVTAAKLADGAVDYQKLSSNVQTMLNSAGSGLGVGGVGSYHLVNGSITTEKLANRAGHDRQACRPVRQPRENRPPRCGPPPPDPEHAVAAEFL